jgi:nucleoside-diphosphate-sugar epimerase
MSTSLDIGRAWVTGATGLIGAKLVARLPHAVVLSRDVESARRKLGADEAYAWTPQDGPPPTAALAGVDAVFHLAGEPVAQGRWTTEKKRRIRDSRVLGTRNLVAALAASMDRPRVLVCASAVGYYGDRADDVLDEHASAGHGKPRHKPRRPSAYVSCARALASCLHAREAPWPNCCHRFVLEPVAAWVAASNGCHGFTSMIWSVCSCMRPCTRASAAP